MACCSTPPGQVLEAQAATAIARLAVHAAWHAANKRSLNLADAHKDYQLLQVDSHKLAHLLPELAVTHLTRLALNSAWYAANTRCLLIVDAARDAARVEEAAASLASVLPPRVSREIKALSLHAAWHAANTRSLLWKDAQRDAARFEECARSLPALLREEGSQGGGILVGRHTWSVALRQYASAALSGAPSLQRFTSVLEDLTHKWRAAADSSSSAGAGDLSCDDLLAAAHGSVAIVECLGRLVSPLARELRLNTDKLHRNMLASPTQSLRKMLEAEACAGGTEAPEGSSALALLWLSRLLRLLERTLATTLRSPDRPFSDVILESYCETLKRHHDFITQRLITAAVWAAPSRAEFLAKLGADEPAAVEASIARMLTHMGSVLSHVSAVLESSGQPVEARVPRLSGATVQ